MKPISCANSLLNLVHLTIDLLPQPSFDVIYGIKWLQFSLRLNHNRIRNVLSRILQQVQSPELNCNIK